LALNVLQVGNRDGQRVCVCGVAHARNANSTCTRVKLLRLRIPREVRIHGASEHIFQRHAVCSRRRRAIVVLGVDVRFLRARRRPGFPRSDFHANRAPPRVDVRYFSRQAYSVTLGDANTEGGGFLLREDKTTVR
jgi:hypothetical protein